MSKPRIITTLTVSSLLLASTIIPAFGAAPDGSGPWADNVVSSSQGQTKDGSAVPAIRSNPSSALGVAENDTADGNFFSLGFGGKITLGFDNGISSGVLVVEATNPGYPSETAKVEVSSDGVTFVMAGNVSQDGTVPVPDSVSCAKFVRITDTSNKDNFSEGSADAYDVDGVKAQGEACTAPTPTPSPKPCGCGNVNINQTNNSNITIGVKSKAKTGNNKANKNTGGSVNITTGNATSNVNVSVSGNVNSATVDGCCCEGGSKLTVSGNGAGSTNTIKIKK